MQIALNRQTLEKWSTKSVLVSKNVVASRPISESLAHFYERTYARTHARTHLFLMALSAAPKLKSELRPLTSPVLMANCLPTATTCELAFGPKFGLRARVISRAHLAQNLASRASNYFNLFAGQLAG